jgi:hypothetical protein
MDANCRKRAMLPKIQVIDIQAFVEAVADPDAPLWCKPGH